jgi:hypothetical protein
MQTDVSTIGGSSIRRMLPRHVRHAGTTCQHSQHDVSAQSAANDRGSRMQTALPRAHTHAHTHMHTRDVRDGGMHGTASIGGLE